MKLPKKLLFIFFLGCMQLATASYGETIKVVTEYLPPFQIIDNNGKLSGYATEVVNELFLLTGDQKNVYVLPWIRAYDIAKKEPNILIYSLAHTQERDNLFYWIGNLKHESFYFWGLKSKFNQRFTSLEQLKHFHIASAKNYNTERYITKNNFKNIYRVLKNEQELGMLYRHRVDLIISNELVLKTLAHIKAYDFSKMVKLFEAKDLSNDLAIAFSLNSDSAIVERFKQAFQQLEQNGKLQNLKTKWGIIDD